jgi:signal transduction histidine kinase
VRAAAPVTATAPEAASPPASSNAADETAYIAAPTREPDRHGATSSMQRALSVRANFLANMTHELRTPLNVILGSLTLLADTRFGALSDDQRAALADVTQAAESLHAVINDILDLTRVETDEF